MVQPGRRAAVCRRRGSQDRFVGICRDFALLPCSLLRARSAYPPGSVRLRDTSAGSSRIHFDHVVTEYWDEKRGWLLCDAQLADPELYSMPFEVTDVPRDRFLVAGRAWQTIRAGEADPTSFGLPLPDGPMVGEWFVAGNIRLDLAALNKVETLLWDVWGTGAGRDDDMTDEIRDLYDRAAAVTAGEVPFAEARALFTGHDGLRTPPTVLSLAPFNGPTRVTLR